jgi:Protein of unknown function (DUF1275)
VSSSSTAVGAPAPVAAASASLRHRLTHSLLALTFTTGLIDAASYLGPGRVFTANMTGSVVLLGFGIAGAAGLPAVYPLVSLAAFLLGAVAGGRLAARTPAAIPSHLRTEPTVIAGARHVWGGAESAPRTATITNPSHEQKRPAAQGPPVWI